MESRSKGCTQEVSAAKAGISERSGRTIEKGKHNGVLVKKRHWQTRKNPFSDVWDSELLPLLEKSPMLQAITLLEHLQDKYPGVYPDSKLRTLQRRVKEWRALSGPDKEVMFRQNQVAGRQGQSDFSHLKRATITIAGVAFKHLLYHFRLPFSSWSHMKVIQGGESYTALAEGLQEALQRLGGAPKDHRTDSLSAAYKNLDKDAAADTTERYQMLCQHYNMTASRNNPGACHENGSVESSHGHIKRRIEQALMLRESYDFESVSAYEDFIDGVVQKHNQRNAQAISLERKALQALPADLSADYTEVRVVVSSSSTIDVKRVTYTVPSRLQGEALNIRLYHNRLICYLGHKQVIELGRTYSTDKNTRARQVDYRHVINSLIKKPQAFRYSQLRDDLLPNAHYKKIWTYADDTMQPRAACKFIVGLLHLAATEDCEEELAETVLHLVGKNKPPTLVFLQGRFKKQRAVDTPNISVNQHSLSQYDQLIKSAQEVHYA